MELHVARQPIFDASKIIIAYELLHRETESINAYTASDNDYATSSVLTSSFLSLGLDTLTDGKIAYVNFTTALLTQGIPLLLPSEQLGIEILHCDDHSAEVINACAQLKALGYSIALDDFTIKSGSDALTDMADIIKVNVQKISHYEQSKILSAYKNKKVKFLAEMVETEKDFDTALNMGYSLFQGYFFAKPVIYSANAIPVSKLGYVQLIQAINEEKPDFHNIIVAIENDVAMSLETIKLVNSAYFARRYKISSVKQAVVTLGIEGIRKWVVLSTLTKLGKNKPDVLISTSIIRSKFMELMAKRLNQPRRSAEFSMLGLFSLLDALTNCSFDNILTKLNISDEIKAILISNNTDTELSLAFAVMIAYERGNWDQSIELATKLGITLDDVAEVYIGSLRWYNDNIWMNHALDKNT